MSKLSKNIVGRLLRRADVRVDGDRPWDIQVHSERFWPRAIRGSLGLGESYLDGDWDVAEIDALFQRLIRGGLASGRLARLGRVPLSALSRVFNPQTRRRSRAVAETHYNLDHRLYQHFLGPYNQYSCCFFNRATTLDEAECEKLEMICDKLALREGERVLDIGSGWGGFARYAAESRGCRVTGVNISTRQLDFAREFTAGLPVDFVECDYRDLPGRFGAGAFDKVVSIGMFEHVGCRNYAAFFDAVRKVMRNDGLFLLHTIGNNRSTRATDPWLEKYIFPNSMLPSLSQIGGAVEGRFVLQDWENYGLYYAETLARWQRRFESNWPEIHALETERPFDERFRRMFNYYLLSCKAAFETEFIHLWQLVLGKPGHGTRVYPRVNLLSGAS